MKEFHRINYGSIYKQQDGRTYTVPILNGEELKDRERIKVRWPNEDVTEHTVSVSLEGNPYIDIFHRGHQSSIYAVGLLARRIVQ